MRATTTLRGASVIALLLAGCGSVPVLIFETDGAPDVAVAVDEDAGTEASSEGGCPGLTPPAGASVCCGPVACNGDCAGRCPECEVTCTSPGTFCCAKANNILCRPVGSVCN